MEGWFGFLRRRWPDARRRRRAPEHPVPRPRSIRNLRPPTSLPPHSRPPRLSSRVITLIATTISTAPPTSSATRPSIIRFSPTTRYFYLGSAQRDRGELAASAQTFERLVRSYPDSVMTPQGEVALAGVYLRLSRADDSAAAASIAISTTSDPNVEQGARMALAHALAAQGNPRGAYDELMTLREKYPRGAHDGDARSLAYAMLAANAEVAKANTSQYHRDEASLLIREAQPSLALREIRAGLALEPPPELRAELIFLKASALRSTPDQAEAAYHRYSATCAARSVGSRGARGHCVHPLASRRPRGRANGVRELAAQFPASRLAPAAMMGIGHTFEEEGKYDSAHGEYLRLVARYPSSEAAEDARFRAPWMHYMSRRYAAAAREFAAMRKYPTAEAGTRDMLGYWEARAKEKSGDGAGARALFESVAQSIDSNYYPALASRRVGAPLAAPAANRSRPQLQSGRGGAQQIRLSRRARARATGYSASRELEPAEGSTRSKIMRAWSPSCADSCLPALRARATTTTRLWRRAGWRSAPSWATPSRSGCVIRAHIGS